MNTTATGQHFKIVRERYSRPRVPAIRPEPEEHSRILFESHAGIALERLETISTNERRNLVVVTHNPCPEYAMDLWDLGPAILLIGAPSQARISRALEDAACHRHYREPTAFSSSLIPSERAILRFLPRGACNKRIASRLGLSDRTVRNRLVDIGEKLGLENRTQIAMYYAGQWQWLEPYRAMTLDAHGASHGSAGWNAN